MPYLQLFGYANVYEHSKGRLRFIRREICLVAGRTCERPDRI